MDIKKKFEKDEKVKVRFLSSVSNLDNWIEGIFCFSNESKLKGIEYAIYLPKLKYIIFVSPEQVFKWEE